MIFASLGNKEATTLGVKITEGEGNLPKLVLTSPAGRCVILYSFCVYLSLMVKLNYLLNFRLIAVRLKYTCLVVALPLGKFPMAKTFFLFVLMLFSIRRNQ
jgi:hypothetical protein